MSVSKYKLLVPTTDKQINIPIEIKWDFTERDQAIDTYQEQIVGDLIGEPTDFELSRFSHQSYLPLHSGTNLSHYRCDIFRGDGKIAAMATSTVITLRGDKAKGR